MRRVVSPLRGEARPRKRFCPPRTRSPQLNLSQPPFEAWCADPIHPHFHSGWQLGDAFIFPPLQPVHSPPASRMLGDTAVSLLQCTEPVPATRQPSTSLSVIPSKDAEGSPSRWRVPLPPGLLDTPSQVCLPLHDTMIPLSHFLHEWERLPGVSLWVLRTIRTGYTLQFGKNPPRFDGVHLTVVNSAAKASVLQQELSSLLQKGAIEEVPQSEVEQGFFSRYFLVPKMDGGLRPILDLRRLNLSLYKGKFKMLTMRTIMSRVQEGDWFVTIDLKDAHFHIQVVHRHRRFLRFAFGGKAYQYKVLPFGLALAPRTFTKCMDAALAPLRLQGIRVLNYLDDWLILAHSRELVSRHRDIVLGHIHSLGLRMNAKKSVLLPSQRTVFLGVRLDSVQMHPGQACAPSSPLVPRQVPLFEGGSRSGSTEPGGRFSVETEAQARGMDVEPSDGIPDLGSVWQSGGGPLCFSRVIPVPALVLPEFPDDSRHRCVRPPMAECQSVRVSANKADSGSTMQSEGERCPSPSHSPILALPDLVLGANSPLVSTSLGDSDQAGLTVPASGQDLASSAGALEVVGMAHTGPRAVIDDLPAEVQETIASARAPATRKLYSSKWGVFESWCLTHAIDPVNYPVGPVLEFLQERLTAGAAATTLRVYVAAIAAQRELDEIPLGRHRLVSAFMRGARRLWPVRPTAVPSWDLSVVLEGLVTAPFEPLESASDRILTLKVVLLLALTSLKRVGDLQAFSVSETCMDFALGLVKVTLRPRPGYIPKVLSTSFRSQVVTLHSFHPPPFASSEDERLHMLCPVRALKLYVDRSKVWRKSPQLLICFGAGRRRLATSKQRISHWVRDDISLAYEARELPSPLSLRAHSTRGVASSQALFRGVPLEDICVAAGWSSPHTFVRFYNLDVDTAPGSQVLSVWTDRMLLVHYWAR